MLQLGFVTWPQNHRCSPCLWTCHLTNLSPAKKNFDPFLKIDPWVPPAPCIFYLRKSRPLTMTPPPPLSFAHLEVSTLLTSLSSARGPPSLGEKERGLMGFSTCQIFIYILAFWSYSNHKFQDFTVVPSTPVFWCAQSSGAISLGLKYRREKQTLQVL